MIMIVAQVVRILLCKEDILSKQKLVIIFALCVRRLLVDRVYCYSILMWKLFVSQGFSFKTSKEVIYKLQTLNPGNVLLNHGTVNCPILSCGDLVTAHLKQFCTNGDRLFHLWNDSNWVVLIHLKMHIFPWFLFFWKTANEVAFLIFVFWK